ncbi:RHS repeat domain-containing protein [Stenotrophomonas maltophilia]|uniref:RHS repeat domain-containing protein n=1 Tax=Stenotrophomonas maltophilia TaxID=40324 RepID=UPI00115E2DC2|nr:RHS repeat domain-containing protein [Stenotrophomonas maltophilia]
MHNRSSRRRKLVLLLACITGPAVAQQYSRTEQVTYHDNTSAWVLGQVATRTINGVVAESTTYDAATALPATRSEFGILKTRLSYNGDGTLASSADGAGNTTRYGNWKRGIPQSITRPDGTTQIAAVSDQGWITQITDENGSITTYGYDSMGRINRVTPPAGDTVNWTPTTRIFESVSGEEHGIAAGHWRQTETTGNAVTVTYYDALWRPLTVWQYDAARVAESQKYTRFAYDSQGRKVFASYPSAAANPSTGVWSEYDALGRLTASSQDSEQGLLITTTAYGADASGAFTLVTQPGGLQTRTWYQMFAEPNYEAPVKVRKADGSITTIARDVFGKPVSISR